MTESSPTYAAAPAKGRIYLVLDMETKVPRFVRASNGAQAIRHVASARYAAIPAKANDLARAAEKGAVLVELASESAA